MDVASCVKNGEARIRPVVGACTTLLTWEVWHSHYGISQCGDVGAAHEREKERDGRSNNGG